MKLRLVHALTAAIAAAALPACSGAALEPGSGGHGSGGQSVTGTGGSGQGSGGGGGTGGNATSGTGNGSGSGGTGTGSSSGGGTGGGAATPSQLDLSGAPEYYRMVRLTNSQWARAVQDILGLAAPSGLEQGFENAVAGTTDFTNNELLLYVEPRSWSDFQSAAESLASQVTATDAALARVYPGTDAAGFIATFGRRAYRRPLTSAEQATYMTLFDQGASLMGTRSTFAKGASLVIRAMLQSPYFLYRSELGADAAPLSGYEMAAKLSLLLRGTTPTDALLDSAAGPGKLDTPEGATALATTMLAESAATGVMRQFHGELYHFDRFSLIMKANVPSYTNALNAEYAETSFLFFDKIFTQGLGLKDALTSTSGFVGPGTAPLYGIAAPSSGYVERDLGAKRVGYFSQLPFLTLYGFNTDPNSILRGVALNFDVLCAQLGAPAVVIPPIPPLQPGQTNRQRIESLTGTCGQSCHTNMINPLGFAFEHFDGMGQWRETESGGLPIDSSGSYTFADGSTKTWSGAADMMQALASESQTHLCYAKKLSSFALQRDIVAKDMPLLTALASTSMTSPGSVKQVITDLVKNNAFRTHVGGTP